MSERGVIVVQGVFGLELQVCVPREMSAERLMKVLPHYEPYCNGLDELRVTCEHDASRVHVLVRLK